MAGNAHKNRSKRMGRHIECTYCRTGRPKVARKRIKDFRNKNGHRRNPAT